MRAHRSARRSACGLLAFVAVRSDEVGCRKPHCAHALAELPEVLEVHHVAGDDCYLVKVRARDAEHLGLSAAHALRADSRRSIDAHHDRARDGEGNATTARSETRTGGTCHDALTPREQRLAYFAWAAVCLIWGTTYLGIRVSLETMPPALMGGLRWTIAGALARGLPRRARRPLPPVSQWGGIALLGVPDARSRQRRRRRSRSSGCRAASRPSSSRPSPFWMAGVEAFLPDGERLTRRPSHRSRDRLQRDRGAGLAGAVAAAPRAAAAFSRASSRCRSRRYRLVARFSALFGRTAAGAESTTMSRQRPRYQMLAGGLMMIAAGTLRGEWSTLFFTTRTTAALLYLVDARRRRRIRRLHLRATTPAGVVRVALRLHQPGDCGGARRRSCLHEPFTWRMAIAAALVFAGVAVVRWRTAARDASATTHARDPQPAR